MNINLMNVNGLVKNFNWLFYFIIQEKHDGKKRIRLQEISLVVFEVTVPRSQIIY
jgi:hypothetical protein